jgi:hypothetical protein
MEKHSIVDRLPRYALVLALLVMTVCTAVAVSQATIVVNGTRYFWLDDDQMITMRYARNFAHGLGPVWNPGEYVEGYTSVGWMLVMTLVHLLPIPDAMTSLAMKGISWILAGLVLVFSDRLLRVFSPDAGWERFAVLVSLALCYDLLFWSVNGFDTTLVTVLFVYTMLRVLRDERNATQEAITYLVVGLLPVARSDAYYLWATVVLVAIAIRGVSRAHLLRVSLCAVIPIGQLLVRHAVYGAWLPNTYYLKVAGMAGLWHRGLAYLTGFAAAYVVALVLAGAGVWWSADRRLRALSWGTVFAVAYVLIVGEDFMEYFRFLAPWVPVLLVMAGAACADLGRDSPRVRGSLAALLLAGTAAGAGIHGLSGLPLLQSVNGSPEDGVVIGVLIRDFTRPEASVAVIAAGNVPYFSHRRAIDLLGKTDARVAHLPAYPDALVGHAKFDIDGSLAAEPDLIVPRWRLVYGMTVAQAKARDFVAQPFLLAILASRRFREDYAGQPVPLAYLHKYDDVFVRRESVEARTLARWREPVVTW